MGAVAEVWNQLGESDAHIRLDYFDNPGQIPYVWRA